MRLNEVSHINENISEKQIEYVLSMFEDRTGSFVDTVTLPYRLGMVSHGSEEEPVKSAVITVIAGPHKDEPCVLFVAYPGEIDYA